MKQLRLAVAVFLFILGLAGVSAAQDQSAQYLQAGNTLYSQKNYDQAIRYYQAVVQFNPNSWQAYQGMGGCYYAKGDNANALTNYQKSLDLNPNNPQVSQFVTYLKSQSTAPALSGGNGSPSTSASSGTVGNSSSPGKFELDPAAGIAYCTSTGYGLGFGGGLSGYFPGGGGLSFGGTAAYYTFGGPSYGSTSYSRSNIEVLASLKYRLGVGDPKPYLIGGAGLSLFSESFGSFSASTTNPMVQGGGGLEFSAGKDMSFFVEGKFSIIIGSGGTVSYLPVEGGLSFNL